MFYYFKVNMVNIFSTFTYMGEKNMFLEGQYKKHVFLNDI
jgi:hypothetical protein